MMRYRSEDFALYLVSIVATGLLIWPALPGVVARGSLLASLVFLLGFFIARHGASWDPTSLRALGEGLAAYPRTLLSGWRTARDAIVPTLVLFAVAVGVEQLAYRLAPEHRMLAPFPWWWAVWTGFALLSAFRLAIFAAHLRRANAVRDFIQSSPQKKLLADIPIQLHVVQAFITGTLAHLTLIAPCVLFYMATDPTWLREAVLLAGGVAWGVVARPLRRRGLLRSPSQIGFDIFHQTHVVAHESRFYFTVLHGHHHDALPSAMIGSAGGTGFLENADRALIWLDPLNSIVLTQINWTHQIFIDMVGHQYIPGVFPYTRIPVSVAAHHMTHHFGSALPLGMVFRPYVDAHDIDSGYRFDNNVTRWFLDEVEKREGLTPEARAGFMDLPAHKGQGAH